MVFFSNQLTGTLPKGIAELSKTMELILLNNNRLRGSIPSELGSLTKLTSLQLQSNSFTGTLPSSFGSDEQPLPLLKQFYVGYNRLTGVLPLSFRHLGAGELESLSVRSNMLTGTIPNDLFANMKELTILELCNNRFSGEYLEMIFIFGFENID